MPWLDHQGARLHYRDSGRGEPVILVHGFSVNGDWWDITGVTDRLTGQRRLIRPDLRGHGRTREPDPPGYRAEVMADDLLALADALGLERFHLLGHSTGGMVALRCALKAGARLKSLQLLGTAPAPGDAFGQGRLSLERFAGVYEGQGWDRIFAVLRQFPGPLLDHLDRLAERETLWARLETVTRSNQPRRLAAFARSFFTDTDRREAELARLTCPTRVVVGEHDRLFRAPCAWLAQTIPGARLTVLSGAGHMLALEDPGAVASIIATVTAADP